MHRRALFPATAIAIEPARGPSARRRRLPAALLLIPIPCLALAASACSGEAAAAARPAARAPRVTVAPAVEREVTEWKELTGWTEAVESVEVRARVSGHIDAIAFEDGAEVQKGDLLFVIDPRPYAAVLERAEASALEAEARLDLAKNDFTRAERLLRSGAIAEEQHDTRGKQLRRAEAAVAAARAAVATARLDVEFTRVVAPIAGRVSRRHVTPGNLVSGGGPQSTLLTTIVTLDPIYAYVDADERTALELRRVLAGQRGAGDGAARLPAQLGLADEQGYPHEGSLDFVESSLDAATGTLRLRAVLPNPDGALAPGLFARVRIPLGAPAPALLVPEEAVGKDQGRPFVLVVDDDGVVARRLVEIGPAIDGARVIRGGLGREERVVVNGLVRAVPGSKVEAVLATAPAGGGA